MDMFFSEYNFSSNFYFLVPHLLELLKTNTGKDKCKHRN